MIREEFDTGMILVADPNDRHRGQILNILADAAIGQCAAANELSEFDPSALAMPRLLIVSQRNLSAEGYAALEPISRRVAENCPLILLLDEDSTAPAEIPGFDVTPIIKPIRARDFLPVVRMALSLKRVRDRHRREADLLRDEIARHRVTEARLKYLVTHDELTGLLNQRSLEKCIQLAIRRCQRFGHPASLLYLDLDRFGLVNDVAGHSVGDQLLVEIADLVSDLGDYEIHAARLRADVFCVLIENNDGDQALMAAEDLRDKIEAHVFPAGRLGQRVSASIGVAMLTPSSPCRHPSDLIDWAAEACRRVKSGGRNSVHLREWNDPVADERQRDIQWISMIRDALQDNRLFLLFQPMIRAVDGNITHYEVLARLRGRDAETLLPHQFIPISERLGLTPNIDLLVVEKAIDFLAGLDRDMSSVKLTINLSGLTFQNDALISLLRDKFETTWVSPERLVFEIRDSLGLLDARHTREMLARIRALGCHLAIDDFGSRFSSVDVLKHFPFDYIKIDGKLIKGLLIDDSEQVWISAMVNLAHRRGKAAIAGFIDSADLLQQIRGFGFDYIQGFHLGKPEPFLLPATFVADSAAPLLNLS